MKSKNKIITLFLLLFSIMTFAQVKIGDNPTSIGTSSSLELESTNKALLLTRVANTAAITTPANGMLIYDLSSNCIKGYENGAWTACLGNNIPAVTVLNCAGATFSPSTIAAGSYYSGTITVPYTTSNGADYTAGTAIASTGVTGLTATLAAGTLVACGGNITYNVTGYPMNFVGTSATFAISFGGQSCSVVSPILTAPTNAIGTGTLSGTTCYDIAVSNDAVPEAGTLADRTAYKTDFSTAITKTYTFVPGATVSNVRFVVSNTNGTVITAITGGNTGNNIATAQTATATFSSDLNTTALGKLSATALTADVYVIYNTGATNNGTDVQVKLTARVKDAQCCGALISSTNFKEFMCHNLGADTTLDPKIAVQGIHGNYYQWGYVNPVADAYTPAGAISGWNTTAAASTAWSNTTKTANDPCPTGYRIPTSNQMVGVANNSTPTRVGSFAISNTNFGSILHLGPNSSSYRLSLPAAGYRNYFTTGSLANRGGWGMYWTSNFASSTSLTTTFYFNNAARTNGDNVSTSGMSIRCISE